MILAAPVHDAARCGVGTRLQRARYTTIERRLAARVMPV